MHSFAKIVSNSCLIGGSIGGWTLPVSSCIVSHVDLTKQESLANARVSARQPWYIGRNSAGHFTPSVQETTENVPVLG